MKVKAVGIDAAFANMGFAQVEIENTSRGTQIRCTGLTLVSTEGRDRKEVRKSSDELRRARELHQALQQQCKDVVFAFIEVPSGSQSASAARSLGIAVGVLASCPILIIEVSPMEVKVAVTSDRKIKASKDDMIAWAVAKWPDAPWLRERKSGRILKSNEHLADALATVQAGISTPEFLRVLTMMDKYETPSPTNLGPTSSRRRLV